MTFSWRYSQQLLRIAKLVSQSRIHRSAAYNSDAPDAEEKTENVRLLLLVKLPDVLVGTHIDG